MPIGVVILLMSFYVLSFTADEYLCSSLQQISKTFKLSESLAGVTLLAFGAGAPDVFASISAARGGDPEGIEMGISVILGSSFFILTVILSAVVLYSPTVIKMNKAFFARDALFLMLSELLLVYSIVLRGVIDLQMSLAFLALYAVYVLVVILQDRYFEAQENSEVAKKAALETKMTELNEI